MKSTLLAATLLALTASSASAGELTVAFGDVAKPDAELAAFISDFKAALTTAKPDYKALDGYFAPSVGHYSRSLDPLVPWFKAEPITGDHLKGIVDAIVEQAPLPDDAKQPDYRQDALTMMAGMLTAGPMGSIKGAKGQVCSPAEYKFDRKAVAAYAKAKDDSVNGLRFFKQAVQLREKPDAKSAKGPILQPGIIVTAITDENVPNGWTKLTGIGGTISGYMKDSSKNPEFYLNQMHICFGKVAGRYKLTSVFSYGL